MEQLLSECESRDQRHADPFVAAEAIVGGHFRTLLFPIACKPAGRVERAGVAGKPVGWLSTTDEDRISHQCPVAFDNRGMGVIAARDECQSAVLDVGQHAVGHQVPLVAQPDRRNVVFRPVERRREMVEHGRGAALFLAGIAFPDFRAVVRSSVRAKRATCRVAIASPRMRVIVIV